jgi:chromosomal replication initiation ATPase DnaA
VNMPLHRILREVCAEHGSRPSEMRGDCTVDCVVAARRKYCVRAKTETTKSLNQIGRVIGRDHTTVLHHLRRAKKLGEFPNHAVSPPGMSSSGGVASSSDQEGPLLPSLAGES